MSLSSIDDFLYRKLSEFATQLSLRGASIIAFALYAGLGLALPLGFGWPVVTLVSFNFTATLFAGLLLLLWFAAQVEARDRRHLVEWTTNLRLLSAEEFEWFVGELFRREGWSVRETGSQISGDGNVDLELTRAGGRMVAQCKRWESWLVPVDEIRKFAGTLVREGLRPNDGLFVTLSDFTPQARAEAESDGITLVDGRELHARAEKVRRTEPCPICEQPMVLNRSPRGWWFRCVAIGCLGKRDLSDDAGVALELLTLGPPS